MNHHKASVIGSPISHSLSPAIFTYISQYSNSKMSRDLEYYAEEIKPEELPRFIEQLKRDLKRVGSNVTLPLKEKVITDLDLISEEVKYISAVNVISNKSGVLKGFNTDVIGIEKTFERQEIHLKGKAALVIGAGGSARAVLYVLAKAGVSSVFVYNPRSDRGEALANEFGQNFTATKFQNVSDFQSLKEIKFSVVVQTTPIGMGIGGKNDSEFFSFLELVSFDQDALAFDLIYTPDETPFLKKAKDLNLKTTNGLGMLIDQALATWEIWNDDGQSVSALFGGISTFLRGVLKARAAKAPILLTGFMGSGKTSVAQKLAMLTQREWVDIDHLVEKKAGMSVSTFFTQFGEPEFRKAESESLKLATKTPGLVIALGGGTLMNAENLRIAKTAGTLVYLSADVKSLNERIAAQEGMRPLMAGLNEEQRGAKIHELLEARKVIYQQATFEILTSQLNVTQVAVELLTQYGALS